LTCIDDPNRVSENDCRGSGDEAGEHAFRRGQGAATTGVLYRMTFEIRLAEFIPPVIDSYKRFQPRSRSS
jgi:hypothetical protein